MQNRSRLVIVSGLSGSGKSTASKALEDVGYYCIDNLPARLLRALVTDPESLVGSQGKIAVVTDVRAPGFSDEIPALFDDLDRLRFDVVVLYLDASEEALLRRFSETRRPHPLASGERPLIEAIRRERQMLADFRGRADLVFDTSDWSVHDVREAIFREFQEGDAAEGTMAISLTSFGFKHGIPHGSDLVFDVRFLPNPHFVEGLRPLSGRDEEVRDFLIDKADYTGLIDQLDRLFDFLLPRYRAENRSYLQIAVGCTGGRHRSVAVSEAIAERLAENNWRCRVHHRDLDR